MGHTCFDVEITDKVGHIKMNRPEKANSMIAEFWNELPEIVDEMSASGAVRAVVLSGEGRHFCSGMDLSVLQRVRVRCGTGGQRRQAHQPTRRTIPLDSNEAAGFLHCT